MDYFELFQLPHTIKIDKKELINKFYRLQKKYHPDSAKIKKKNKNDQLSVSIKINQGFSILKHKFTRVKHLLELKKKKLFFKEKTIISKKKWLLEQFQLYETIKNIKNTKNKKSALAKINDVIQVIKNKIKLYFLKLENQIKEKNIHHADQIFYQLSFIYKISKKAKNFKKKIINQKTGQES